MAGEYQYYEVESTFVARVGPGTTERLLRDGTWEDYDDRWRVLTDGHELEDEEEAHDVAQQLWAKHDRRKARA